MRTGISVFLLGWFLPALAAAQEMHFQHLLTADGLPQTQVLAIHQSTDGYLWAGTYGGAARYNGREMIVFDTGDGFSSNTILAISSTADGRVWMGTANGLCWIDPPRPRFECSADARIANNAVQDLLPSSKGMWLATARGLYHVALADPGTVEQVLLADRNISTVRKASDDTLWIATLTGLFRLTEGGDAPQPVHLPDEAGQAVLALQPDGDRLWIGTDHGLFVKDGDAIRPPSGLPSAWKQDDINAMTLSARGDVWIATPQGVLRQTGDGFELLAEDSGLLYSITHTIFSDREGVIWIGHDSGLTRYAPSPFVGYRKKHGLLHYFVRTLREDVDGNLWLGSRAGAQRVPYRDGEWQFEDSTVITGADGLVDPRVYSIAFPADGDVLLATGDGVVRWREGEGIVYRYTMDDGLPGSTVEALYAEPGGRVWFGTELGVVTLEDGVIKPASDPELATAYVYQIERDVHGRLWFGSQDRGLFRVANGKVAQLTRASGLTDATVWDIAPDRDGGVWAGSNGEGLFHVRADGSIRRYTTADGLSNDFVWQVLLDDQDRVWTYTSGGISRLENGAFTNFGLDDGLLNLEGGATGAIQTHDGTLWFSSADGLLRYVPEREARSTLPPPVLIERVTVAGEPVDSGMQLPYPPGLLDIHYAALSFERMDEIEYRYRLRGADEEWSTTSKYRPLSFANLGAGDYVFEVTARKAGGEWNPDIARFEFRIQAPFWQTAWFSMLATLVFGSLVWFAMRFRLQRAQRRQRELAAIVAERTGELKDANEQLQKTASDLQSANEQLQNVAITDPLTGLRNRRYLTSQIVTDVAQTRRPYHGSSTYANKDIVFLMVDLDHFKRVNDTYGHAVGDRVLKESGKTIQGEMRESDYVVRWGGEEFLVIARNTEASQCRVIADRILNAVRAQRFELDDGTVLHTTCSIGASHLPLFSRTPEAVTWEHVIEVADTAVYMAKALGRNGWVSILGFRTDDLLEDASRLMTRIKTDLDGLVAEGILAVDTSFDTTRR